MEKRSKTKPSTVPSASLAVAVEGHDISQIVEGILDVLGRHEAQPDEGVVSLLTAFMQAADRVMEVSTPEETEHNRAALLAMLDKSRHFIDSWPLRTPAAWPIH